MNRFYEVVICFHFSIFEPLETVPEPEGRDKNCCDLLSFLVSLNHWKQYNEGQASMGLRCDLLSF